MAVQCKGLKQRYGLSCHNQTVSKNGLCWQHQPPEVQLLREIRKTSEITAGNLERDASYYRKKLININRMIRRAISLGVLGA